MNDCLWTTDRGIVLNADGQEIGRGDNRGDAAALAGIHNEDVISFEAQLREAQQRIAELEAAAVELKRKVKIAHSCFTCYQEGGPRAGLFLFAAMHRLQEILDD